MGRVWIRGGRVIDPGAREIVTMTRGLGLPAARLRIVSIRSRKDRTN